MRRLFRFLATIAVLLGLLPCELREALPLVGEAVVACCADEADAGDEAAATAHDDDDGAVDCCDTAACRGVARATAPMPGAGARLEVGYLLVDAPTRVDRPEWRAGAPPTPPPMA